MELSEFKMKVLVFKNKLFRFAKQWIDSETEAEDTVQDTFIKLWNMKEKLNTYNSIEALAMRMTKNNCLNRFKAKANRMYSMDVYTENKYMQTNEAEKALTTQDLQKIIQKAMQQLSEMQRTVIHLRDVEEYEMEEIAQIIQKDEAYVRVNLSRGRKKMRELLTQANIYGTH